MLNKVILIGRLTKDAEKKAYTVNGEKKALATFSLAVPKDKENTNFFECVAYSTVASTICTYTKKGSKIGIVGRLEQKTYTNKAGAQVNTVNIVVDTIELLDPLADKAAEDKPTKKESKPSTIEVNEQDLPF